MRGLFALLLSLALVFVAGDDARAQTAGSGPSNLTENWNDWTVVCRTVKESGRVCAFTQQLIQQNGGGHVLTVELTVPGKGGLQGNAILPFGLDVLKRVTLSIDDVAQSGALAFRTCMPAGCIVPLTFSAAQVKALRSGKVLKISALVSETGEKIQLPVSLAGFGSAYDRAAELSGR